MEHLGDEVAQGGTDRARQPHRLPFAGRRREMASRPAQGVHIARAHRFGQLLRRQGRQRGLLRADQVYQTLDT